MKKILALLLVALMTISMVACGEETTSADNSVVSNNTSSEESNSIVTKDDLLAEVEQTDVGRLLDSEDVGKVYVAWGIPMLVADSYCTLDAIEVIPTEMPNVEFRVTMSEDELATIEDKKHAINIIGIIEDVTSEVRNGFGITVISMSNGYYVDDELEVTGIISKVDNTENTVWIIVDATTSEIELDTIYDYIMIDIPFAKDIIENLNKGDTISVKGNLDDFDSNSINKETPRYTINNAELLK